MAYDEDWDRVMAKYHYTCCWPYCLRVATVVHEEPPRGLERMRFENRYPMCREHHEEIQGMERTRAKEVIVAGALLVLSVFPPNDPVH